MFGLKVRDVMDGQLLTMPRDACVDQAVKMMARDRIGAVMVVDNGRLSGIFTERDAVFRVMAADRDAKTTRLAEVMTADPKTVDPDKSFGYAMLLMFENGFRHVPVIDNDRLIGIVSARNALDPDLEEFVAESQRRRQILSERR